MAARTPEPAEHRDGATALGLSMHKMQSSEQPCVSHKYSKVAKISATPAAVFSQKFSKVLKTSQNPSKPLKSPQNLSNVLKSSQKFSKVPQNLLKTSRRFFLKTPQNSPVKTSKVLRSFRFVHKWLQHHPRNATRFQVWVSILPRNTP